MESKVLGNLLLITINFWTVCKKSLKFQKCVCFNYHTPLAILTLALLFLLAACWIYGDTTNFFQFLSKSVVPTNDGRPSQQFGQGLSEVAFKRFFVCLFQVLAFSIAWQTCPYLKYSLKHWISSANYLTGAFMVTPQTFFSSSGNP